MHLRVVCVFFLLPVHPRVTRVILAYPFLDNGTKFQILAYLCADEITVATTCQMLERYGHNNNVTQAT
jgi:hypothetical protein